MIGERLQELYEALLGKGLITNKKDFSDILGIDYGSLSKYFTNKVNLSLNNLNYGNYKKLASDWRGRDVQAEQGSGVGRGGEYPEDSDSPTEGVMRPGSGLGERGQH